MGSDGLARAVEALPLHWHGRYLEAVDSTQDEARTAARAGAPHRSLFVADFQRAGRGRQARSWIAAPGDALMVSVVFRETRSAALPWRWTSLASVSLTEAIEELMPGLRPAIKWPNDVLLDGRKVAGILAENIWTERNQLLAIVGVGVNVRTPAADLALIGGTATSLRVASGRDGERGALLLAFVRKLDAWMARPVTELHSAWQARLWGRGQRVRMADLGRDEDVVVLGAEPDGSLRVRLSDGTERLTTTGELIL
jgi:BirA family biotin operon repressor/biotin-[acetyl-CoA-carboxylase] ligase